MVIGANSPVYRRNRARLNKAKESLKAQKADLEAWFKARQDAVINVPNLQTLTKDAQGKLHLLDFEGKRSGEGFCANKAILVNAPSRVLSERVVLMDFTKGRIETAEKVPSPLEKRGFRGIFELKSLLTSL